MTTNGRCSLLVSAAVLLASLGALGMPSAVAGVISARPADLQLMREVEDQSFLGLEMLGGLQASDAPGRIVDAIDRYVVDLQAKNSVPWDAWYKYYTPLGALWGEEIGRTYDWEWERVWLDENEGQFVYAIVSPDRSMVIYPFRYLIACLEDGKPIAVSRVYQALGDEREGLDFPPGSYTDILANPEVLLMPESESRGTGEQESP